MRLRGSLVLEIQPSMGRLMDRCRVWEAERKGIVIPVRAYTYST